jgi:Cu+-exporting ATPase
LASQDALSTTETLRLVVEDGSIERAVRFSVFGMAKSACASTVELGLKNLPGVMSAKVSLLTETADVRFDERRIGLERLLGAVEENGLRRHAAGRAGDNFGPKPCEASRDGHDVLSM